MPTRHIIVVTGASGAGKTASVQALDARGLAGVQCFYFDSIGVPSPEAMERDFGGGERWQTRATTDWVSRLHALGGDVDVAILDGQTRPSFVFDAGGAAASSRLHVVLLDCSPDAPRLPIIDTSRLSIVEVADELESIARSLPR